MISVSGVPAPRETDHMRGDPLIDGGALLILAVISLRVLATALSQSTFDIDPVVAMHPQGGVTPAASLGLDCLALVGSVLILVGLLGANSGRVRHVSRGLLLLVALPIPAALSHASIHFEAGWRGAAWASAVIGAVALVHALQAPHLRRAAIAILLGVVAALVVKGAGQILIEHPATVAEWDANRATFLAERGWAPDSAAARIFEERLRQAEATGWFGLSNAFSTVMLGTSLSCAAFVILGVRRHLPGGLVGVAALLGLGSGGLLIANGSKGAIVAALLGAMLLAVGFGSTRSSGPGASLFAALRKRVVALALALIALAWLGVLARGLLLPEGFAGEKSLLFRFHYLTDALRVIAAHPLRGVGPGGFQEAMVAVRPPRHPEEVSSAHSAIVDWLVAFGPFGLAWGALLIMLVIGAARTARAAIAGPSREMRGAALLGLSPARRSLVLAAGVAAIGLFALWLEAVSLDGTMIVLRLAGVFAAAATTLALDHLLEWLERPQAELSAPSSAPASDHRLVCWALFAAAVAMIIHVQIEMTLWLPNAVGWVLAFLAVAAPLAAAPSARAAGAIEGMSRVNQVRGPFAVLYRLAPVAAVVALLGGAIWAVASSLGAQYTEQGMRRAAAPLEAVGRAMAIGRALEGPAGAGSAAALNRDRGGTSGPSPLASSSALPAALIDDLELALNETGAPAGTRQSIIDRFRGPAAGWPVAHRTLVEVLREERNINRARAIDALLPTGPRSSFDRRPQFAAVDEALRLDPAIDPELRAEGLRRTLFDPPGYGSQEWRSGALAAWRRVAELREAIWLLEGGGSRDDTEAEHVATAESATAPAITGDLVILAWQEVLRRDPAALPVVRRLADIAERTGRIDLARELLERALVLDRELVLDPRKQLTDREREAIRERLRCLGSAARLSREPRGGLAIRE